MLFVLALAGHAQAQGHMYFVDCSTSTTSSQDVPGTLLRSLAEVNQAGFRAGDRLEFARGTLCEGTLAPQGSGSVLAPITIASYGSGALPRIHAPPGADFSLRLHNQEYWTITDLDLQGGDRGGLSITASAGTMHDIILRDLRVHDVLGPIHGKEDGLVSIHPTNTDANFDHVVIDNVQAFNTSQWSGIFVSGASLERRTTRVEILNSIAHDVQGDGIVLFVVRDGTIRNSTAWHTGMQHSYTIGTPNAIWTWRCDRCTVERSEAFLTDSPGVDGGSFDIDFGNSKDRVIDNFGHHTQGYCVSVFGAFEETSDSEVARNTCLQNGLSPRLAERQGAILLMTWSKGTIRGVNVHDNTIFWNPAGSTPAVQLGEEADISGLMLTRNTIYSTSPLFVNSRVHTIAVTNQFYFAGSAKKLASVRENTGELIHSFEPCRKGHYCPGGMPYSRKPTKNTKPIELTLRLRDKDDEKGLDSSRAWLSILSSIRLQFGNKPAEFSVEVCRGHERTRQLVQDLLIEDVDLLTSTCKGTEVSQFELRSEAQPRRTFTERTPLWFALADRLGEPVYGTLPMVEARAHD